MTKVILPEVTEGMREATISYWHFEEGDKVEEGEDLVEICRRGRRIFRRGGRVNRCTKQID